MPRRIVLSRLHPLADTQTKHGLKHKTPLFLVGGTYSLGCYSLFHAIKLISQGHLTCL